MTINELRKKRYGVWEKAKAFLEERRQENGTLTAEDDETYSKMEDEIVSLGKEIERLERAEKFDAKLSEPVSSPITGKPGAAAGEEEKTGRASKAYARDLISAMRNGFRQVSDVLEEGTDANGGYLVPAEWDSRLIDVLKEEKIGRASCRERV